MLVVLGADGMLGRAFRKYYHDDNILFLTRNDCNFTNSNKLISILNTVNCSAIINCAALIDINEVEEFPDKAFEINTMLPFMLAKYCSKSGAKLVHISTDHFYNDDMQSHKENDPVTLLNKYAEQKYIAESLVLHQSSRSLIIRTSIIGYKNLDGNTFVEWILKTLKNEKSITGFSDAFTSSIDVDLLCVYIDKAIKKNLSGIYNIGTKEPYSKLKFIEAVINELQLDKFILYKDSVKKLKVIRANNCSLNTNKFSTIMNLDMPNMNDIICNLKIKEFYNEI